MNKQPNPGTRRRVLQVAAASTLVLLIGLMITVKFARGIAAPRVVAGWRATVDGASRIDSTNAPVTVVLFADYECPYCAEAWKVLRAAEAQRPGTFELRIRHLPLPQHLHALDAALAAQCASITGHLSDVSDSLYSHQDEIGVRPWSDFAASAGYEDATAFATCMHGGEARARVQADVRVAVQVGVRGTPTMLVNDRLYTGVPTDAELARRVTDAGSRPANSR